MQVTVETTQGLERRMRVEIPEDRIRIEVDKRLGNLARNVRIPGFRPGKVPIKVVARRYGRQMRAEVIGEIVQESFTDALGQEQLRPAATARIEPLESDADTGVRYTATFDVFPDISLPSFDSIEILRPVAAVADDDVDRMLETLRIQHRTWKTVERAATPDDRVVVDFEGFMDGEPLAGSSATEMPVHLDARRMVEGFEDALVGARAGEDRTLDLAFSQSHPGHLAGKPVTFHVKVHRVEEPELPDLDAAFAERLGAGEGGVDALRNEVRASMERELSEALGGALKQRVLEALLASTRVELPESKVREEMERVTASRREELKRSGLDPERVELERAALEELVRRRIAVNLLLAEIIEEEAIEIDSTRVHAHVEAIASTFQDPAKAANWYYADRKRLSEIESHVLEEQAVEWILAHARIVDERSSFDRIMNRGQTNPAIT